MYSKWCVVSKKPWRLFLSVTALCNVFVVCLAVEDVTRNLEHIVEHINNEKDSFFAEKPGMDSETCLGEETCKKVTQSRHCWGYEEGCDTPDKWFLKPECNDEQGYQRYKSIEEKVLRFWNDADFGYVKKFKNRLRPICKPKAGESDGSSFECSDKLGYCKAKNLYMDLRIDDRTFSDRIKDDNVDMFKPGQLGGYCDFNSSIPLQGHRMSLSSWVSEVEKFSSLPFDPIKDGHCDVVIERPTFFMKLDAVVNMYHHFCDFFNLYATQHLNGSFHTDVNIVLWESHHRRSLGNFGTTWKAFTDHPVLYLGHEYGNKRVCFRHAIFTLLPRMLFGLYYNTPLIPGCFKSGLFKAFSDHVLARLGVEQERKAEDVDEPVRVTLLARGTKYRQILNQKELVAALDSYPAVVLNVSTYTWNVPFLEQLQRSHNTDILIGMHGAGLTHALFLPDWALLFELYNCDDDRCYFDLARLRGVDYLTWENRNKVVERTEELHPTYSENPKFRNYAFDVTEFMRKVDQAVTQVKQNLRKYKRRHRKWS